MNGNRKRSRGFTLLELMIVVAIIGILLALATPAYREQVRKTRRASATADVMEMAQQLERFHTVNNTYDGFPEDPVPSPGNGLVFYLLVPSALTATTYLITATPQDDQTNERCGELTLNQANVRTESGADTDVNDCW